MSAPKRVFRDVPFPHVQVIDELLAEVAANIQLTPTLYQLATERFDTLAKWIDVPGSPLYGRVKKVYAQGSMGFGATIRSRDNSELFDIDVLVQVELPPGTTPLQALQMLEKAIRREKGSQYYDCTVSNTRCVTVIYAEMKIDFTLQIRDFNLPERGGHIPHAKREEPPAKHKWVLSNPWGFAQWFLAMTTPEKWFALDFAKRSYSADSFKRARADTEPVPEQMQLFEKSMAVVSLQLLKRRIQRLWEKRNGRMPPSILISKLVADSAGQAPTLSDSLIHHARFIRGRLEAAETKGQLIVEANPSLTPEKFTDRWPESREAQRQFIADLKEFESAIRYLQGDLPMERLVAGLAELFGEVVTGKVAAAFQERIRNNKSRPATVAANTGRVVSAVQSAAIITAPIHRQFGSED